mgnify:CR=1 FL=1
MGMLLTKLFGKGRKLRGAIIAAAVVVVLAVPTLAFLLSRTEPVVNSFLPSKVTCEINETFENGVKTDVSVKNTGNTTAYIRASIVVSWVDESGNISAVPPIENTDYSMALNLENGWVQGSDGYYYYTKAVEPDKNTGVLITECKQLKERLGYKLSVNCIASALQSSPASAVGEAWSATVDSEGSLEVTTNA